VTAELDRRIGLDVDDPRGAGTPVDDEAALVVQQSHCPDRALVEHATVGAPPTWVLSNHDVARPVSRYARAQTRDLVTVRVDVPFGEVNYLPSKYLKEAMLTAQTSMRHE
jgi:hypothetical protein